VPARGFDDIAESYDRRESLRGDPLEAWLRASLPSSGGTAVDLACGAGRHSLVIAERYRDVLAVDLSQDMVELARRRRPASNITYRAADLMAIDGRFDLVFCSSALHDVDDLDRALRRIRSLVAPGGMAIVADVVGRLPSRPAWLLRTRALLQLPVDALRSRDALELYRLSTEPAWLAHLASDRYLTRAQFEQRYGRRFDGASFARAKHLHVCRWHDR
jgi:ubiquinone/menaquinone biosynthesis C-methylase UbiE